MKAPRSWPLMILIGLGACDDYDANVPASLPCESFVETFADDIYGSILSERCIVCHREGGLAGSSDLVLARGDDDATALHNLAVVTRVAKKTIDGESVLLLRPSGRHPSGHTGGVVLDPTGADYATLAHFVAGLRTCIPGTPSTLDCDPELGPTGPRLVRRLSRAEWAASVRSLLRVDADIAALAPDDVQDGFDNQADALVMTPLLLDQLRGEAERLSRLAIESHPDVITCDLGQAGCPSQFVRELAFHAFRRPASDDEIATYLGLFESVRSEDGNKEAAVWVVTALLQSPSFLYRSELGVRADDGRFMLTDWERASALAYAVWGGPPDEELMRHASRGELSTPAVLEGELARLLTDPRADATLAAFGTRWLGIDRLPIVTRDQSIYPELTPEIRADMAGEAARFFVDVAAHGGTTRDLLTHKTGFMTERLADFYGLPRPSGDADAQGFRAIDLAGTPYGGLIRLGAVLTTHALPQSSSPIHRGKMVRERLLCEDLPPPPSNLDTSPPPVDPSKSTRERYAAHAALDACAKCHDKIDPIGFGLEHFDGIGRWREMDGIHAIDDSGKVNGLDALGGAAGAGDGSFDGPDALAEVLVDSGVVDHCWLVQRLRYTLGYDPSACLVDDVAARHDALGDTLAATWLAIVDSPAFVARHGGASEGDTLAVGAWDFDDPPTDPVDPIEPTDPTDPTGPTPVGTLRIEAQETSRWDHGYCFQVAVTNVGGAASGWVVERAVEGSIDNLWGANSAALSGGRLRFTGLDWNATLGPGAGTTFGFCAKI